MSRRFSTSSPKEEIQRVFGQHSQVKYLSGETPDTDSAPGMELRSADDVFKACLKNLPENRR